MKTQLLPLLLLVTTIVLLAGKSTTTADTSAGMADFPQANPAPPDYPFSRAVRAGNFVYISGQIGATPDGKLAGDFDAQARQTMDNIVAALNEQNLTTANIVKCTVMIDDMAKWPAFNTIYRSYFPNGKFPARSAFGADGLAMGAALEVDCIAYAPLAK